MSLAFETGGLELTVLPEISTCVGVAPNVNSCGGTFRGERSKMDGALALLKAGTVTGSLIFGKPMLNEGAAAAGKTG